MAENTKKAKIEAVSYKNRKVSVGGQWIHVAHEIDLRTFRIGKVHEVETEVGLDDKIFISKLHDGEYQDGTRV